MYDAKYQREYYLSHKIKIDKYLKNRRQTEKGKVEHSEGNKVYRKTEKGKLTTKRYRQKEKEKIVRIKGLIK